MIGYPHVARRRAIQFQHKSRRDPLVAHPPLCLALAYEVGTEQLKWTPTRLKEPSTERALISRKFRQASTRACSRRFSPKTTLCSASSTTTKTREDGAASSSRASTRFPKARGPRRPSI